MTGNLNNPSTCDGLKRCDRVHREFLSERELAERWNRSPRTLQRMRQDGYGPAFHKIGGSILYKLDDIKAFEAAARTEGVA